MKSKLSDAVFFGEADSERTGWRAGGKIKRILVAVDFSDCSRRAVAAALEFAHASKAEVILLHVFEPVPPPLTLWEGVFAEASFYDQAGEELRRWAEEIRAKHPVQSVLRKAASPAREIVRVATEFESDLIVMGRHSRSALGRLMMGSTAAKVFKSAPCAVLVIASEELPGETDHAAHRAVA